MKIAKQTTPTPSGSPLQKHQGFLGFYQAAQSHTLDGALLFTAWKSLCGILIIPPFKDEAETESKRLCNLPKFLW